MIVLGPHESNEENALGLDQWGEIRNTGAGQPWPEANQSMSIEKHEFRHVVTIKGAGAQSKRRPQNREDEVTRKSRRRSSRKHQAALLYPPDISRACIEDADLPLVITSNAAHMEILERLSTYKSQGLKPYFLPVQVIKPSRANLGHEFGTLESKRRKIFLLGPDLGAIARQFSRAGAKLYDLNAAAAGGFETLDHCLATEGMSGALKYFDRAEQYFKRHVPEGFLLLSDGLYSLAQSLEPESQEEALLICKPVYVKAYTRDHENQNWGKLIEFLDNDGYRHRCLIPMSALVGHGRECWTQFLSRGLQIARNPRVRELLIAYISDADPEERVRCTNRLGWHDGTFVLLNESIQPEKSEPVLYQTARKTKRSLAPSGSLKDWINEIGRYCPGNPRLLFAVSCAFAPPLLQPTHEPGGGFHFHGGSSTGKTTALLIAASVWDGPGDVQNWRMTANSFDAVAANHNDGLLCMDELGQGDPREGGPIVYALANGSPKQRMTQNMPQWNLFISFLR